MTPRELSTARDLITRARLEAEKQIDVGAREAADRAALGALHEAERRAQERRSRTGTAISGGTAAVAIYAPPSVVPTPATDSAANDAVSLSAPVDDLCSTLMDALALRIAAAMPPLDFVADGFDLAAHTRRIIDVARGARAAEASA